MREKPTRKLRQFVSETSELPIYWINLDESTDRRAHMESLFTELHKETPLFKTTRIPGTTANNIKHLLEESQLILSGINLVHYNDATTPKWVLHKSGNYTYSEAGCLLSHLRAIQHAYVNGEDLVLIVEDDILLDAEFLEKWRSYAELAPPDWQILQWFTGNEIVVESALKMSDPWLSWLPDHYGTTAYMINREGMKSVLSHTSEREITGGTVWKIDKPGLLVSDEVVYYYAKAYTTSYPWMKKCRGFPSTLGEKSRVEQQVAVELLSSQRAATPPGLTTLPERILVVVNLHITGFEAILPEFIRLWEDYEALAVHHPNSSWIVYAVVQDYELKYHVDQAAMAIISGHPKIEVISHLRANGRFNEFEIVAKLDRNMTAHDYVLLKDSRQRIVGFPWVTFMKKKGDAVMAGPLRQGMEESLLRFWLDEWLQPRMWFKLHDANSWKRNRTSPNEFRDLMSITVPFLESDFILIDAGFAASYFAEIPRKFFEQPSSWGVDLAWCGAAKDYEPKRTHCTLVPVVSLQEEHEGPYELARQPSKSSAIKYFKDERFSRWMKYSNSYVDLAGNYNKNTPYFQCHKSTLYFINHNLTACIEKFQNLDREPSIT